MNNYTNAQYYRAIGAPNEIGVRVDISGVTHYIPGNEGNPLFEEIMALVAAGELTIAPAGE